MGFIPILIPVVLNSGFEVRAYSMESLGTVLSIIGLIKLKNNLTLKHLFFWSCVFSFFMTSRYSEILVIFIVSLYILFLIFRSDTTLKQKISSFAIYIIPLIVTLICIYHFALASQNSSIIPMDYLRYLKNDKNILLEPGNFLSICLIGIFILLFLLKKRYPIIKRYEVLLLVAITTNILFIILAFLGKYPWDLSGVNNSRCISLLILFSLCISAFLGELLRHLFKKPKILKYYLISLLLMFTLYLRKNKLFPRLGNHNNTYADFQKININNFPRIFVDSWQSPCVRYLFEYGAMRHQKGTIYPNNFTFSKNGHHCKTEEAQVSRKKSRFKGSILEYDLVITFGIQWYGKSNEWKQVEGTSYFYVKK